MIAIKNFEIALSPAQHGKKTRRSPLALQTIFEARGASSSKDGRVTKAAAVMRATREAHAQGVERAKRKEKEGLDTAWAKTALRREKIASEEEEEEEVRARFPTDGRFLKVDIVFLCDFYSFSGLDISCRSDRFRILFTCRLQT